MPQTYTTISVPREDLDAADRVFGRLLPVGRRLGMGATAFSLLTAEQQMEIVRTHGDAPVTKPAARTPRKISGGSPARV